MDVRVREGSGGRVLVIPKVDKSLEFGDVLKLLRLASMLYESVDVVL